MKFIKKANKQISLKLKLFFCFLILFGLISFLLNIRYSGKAKNNFPNLHFSSKLSPPICNKSAGFYNKNITIELFTSEKNCEIYYTLDGSEPYLSSSRYSVPFSLSDATNNRNVLSAIPTSPRWKPPVGNLSKGIILRAIVVDKYNYKSEELIKSFFVFDDTNKRYSLPVISISLNEKDFFGFNKGIYVLGKRYTDKDNYIDKNIPLNLPWWEYPANYLLRGNDAEREAHIEFFENDGHLGFESNVGLRINGNATRGFAQKSLRVSFRKKYGNSNLIYDLFDENTNHTYHSFILRNSGNDWDKTMFRDAFMQSLMKNSFVDIQDYRASIVFINGEYWGIHNIRERFDEFYLSEKYNLNPDSVTILELGGDILSGDKSEKRAFLDLIEFVKNNDLSIDKNYKYIESKIDLKSFSDFVIANVYFCNSDWPNNNVKFWKYNSKVDSIGAKDGKWRWMLYDTDWGFGYNNLSKPESNLLEKAKSVGSVGVFFAGLIRNKQFVNFFLNRFKFHLNTSFNTKNVLVKINQFKNILKPEIQEHINRWRAIGSYTAWLENIEILNDFAIKRPQIQIQQLNDFFKLKEGSRIELEKIQ